MLEPAQRLAQDARYVALRFPSHLRERDFWTVQVGVLTVTALHLLSEALTASFHRNSLGLHHIPVILYAFPIAYASMRYGWEGGLLTSGWVTLLILPNIFLWHRALLAWAGEVAVTGVVITLGVVLASRVAMEARLRRQAEASEARYRALFERAGDAILVYDRAGRVVEANPAASRLFGTPSAEALRGASIAALMAGLDSPTEADPGRPLRVTLKWGNREGGVAEVVVVPLRQEGEERFQAIVRDVTSHALREAGLRSLVHRITRAQEEEQERIARELHDETLQALILLAREQENLARSPRMPASLRAQQLRLADLARRTAESLRRFSRDLRPPALKDLGLVPALEWLVREASCQSGVPTSFVCTGRVHRLPQEVETALFRIAQEALRNAYKHARATRVEVAVRFTEEGVQLTVWDDGVGFSPPANFDELVRESKLGLIGMKERAALAGGDLTVHSAPGRGTRLEVRIPARPEDPPR